MKLFKDKNRREIFGNAVRRLPRYSRLLVSAICIAIMLVVTWAPLIEAMEGAIAHEKVISATQLQPRESLSAGSLQTTNVVAQNNSTPGNVKNSARNSEVHTVRAGDTLWDIAEDKLTNGFRWHEIQRKDGSDFTESEARLLQIGTLVYLPPFTSGSSGTNGETSPGASPPNGSPGTGAESSTKPPGTGSGATPETPPGSSLPNGAPGSGAESENWDLISRQSDIKNLAPRLAGDVAAGSVAGYIAAYGWRDFLGRRSLPDERRARRSLPDQWKSKWGLQPWSKSWTEVGQKQFRDDASRILDRKIRANPNTPLNKFAQWDQESESWKLKPEYEAGHMASKLSGTREMFAIEHKDFNRGTKGTSSYEKKLKQQGTFLRKRAISIDGVPVEIQTARNDLPKDIVDNARTHPGWARRRIKKPRAIKVTEGSANVFRDQLIRRELENLTPEQAQELERKLAAGTTTDADLDKLNPQSKAQVEKLRDIAKHPRKRFDRELSAFYEETLRDSVTDTKNPARERDVTDSRKPKASNQSAPEPKPEPEAKSASKSRSKRAAKPRPKPVPKSSATRRAARGAARVLGPVAVGLDAYELNKAYKADGNKFGKNTKRTTGSVAGGWGGAAAGAAAGAAIGAPFAGVGAIPGAAIGGVVGGIGGAFGGSIAGEKIADWF